MKKQKPFYLTTPIYYVNGSPHFAHAYTSTVCDFFARFHRLDGREVRFLTGTDEHGQKVAEAARTRGLAPQLFCDEISQEFRNMTRLMNISNDDFIRTTEPRHIHACQTLWRVLQAKGQIYLGQFSGWYSVRDESYFDEDELVEGKAPTGAPVEWVREENYFFRLSNWGEALLQFYEQTPDFIAPGSRRNEIIRFVKSGLRDLSISRTNIDWGIPVPDAPGHVMYVWFDALPNYLTGAGYPDQPDGTPLWPADLHLIGKDIIRFHCVYWPAFLMAAGLTPPRRVFAHGWWTVEGEKMSKSLNNFVLPQVIVDRYGVEEVRYFMARELALGADGDLSEAALHRRITGELNNEFGNLAYRTLTMVASYFGGIVPEPGALSTEDLQLLDPCRVILPAVRADMAVQALQSAMSRIWEIVAAANRYVNSQKPWHLAKLDRQRLATVLYNLLESLRVIGLLLQPVVPVAAARLLDQLSVPRDKRSFSAIADAPLPSGAKLPTPEILFPRRVEFSIQKTPTEEVV